jgi:fused signal recognition particle receptor
VDPFFIVVIAVAVVVAVGLAVFALRRRATEVTPRPPAVEPSRDAGLRTRLSRSRSALASSLGRLSGSEIVTEADWTDIEDALILADVGASTSSQIVDAIRRRHPKTGAEARTFLEQELVAVLDHDDRDLRLTSQPSVVVVVGVNGTGKTTSIAKIAQRTRASGKQVVLGAADTFRAAADEQLRAWGERVGVPVVSGSPGSDPASVAFEALRTGRETGADVVVIDTAGRLHSQANLMDELRKVMRVLDREAGGVDEVLLVLDGAVGQNGATQARAFTEAVGVTGIVITKLDGTAKGGCAIAIERELGVPIKFIGVGEGTDDLIPFVPEDFVRALVAE